MSKKNEVYPVEKAAESFFKELARFVKKAGNFLFQIPKKKMDKIIYAMDILAWAALTISLVLRIVNR